MNFLKKKTDAASLEIAYKECIEQLRANEQFGTADSYKISINSLQKYKNNLRFEHITKEFLQVFKTDAFKGQINYNRRYLSKTIKVYHEYCNRKRNYLLTGVIHLVKGDI